MLFCGTSVQGPVTLTDATGAVELGGGPGSTCAQDKLNGPVTVFGGQASTSIEGTALVGPLSVAGNSGPVTVSDDTVNGPADISLNTGGGP